MNPLLKKDVTVHHHELIPHILHLSSFLVEMTMFSKIDLARGYHKIHIFLEDIAKTEIIAPFWLYEYLRMPFGLKNAAQTLPTSNG